MRTITLLSMMLAAFTLFSQGTPKIEFKEKAKVFKDVKVGETLKFSYEFKNTGSADLKITHVHPT
ncbi:DUF1573 domain-containing protein, partial [bacterium]|nr:DUF1573 domain-containing protein [bacterium]